MIWKLITGVMTFFLVAISLLFLDLFEILTVRNSIIAGGAGLSAVIVLILVDVFAYSQVNSKSNSRTLKNIK